MEEAEKGWAKTLKGKLIAIEAGDGSGKGTQTEKLYRRLTAEGYRVKKVEFPNYASPASALIKMYLNGEFGSEASVVDPYVASTFYTVDRYASYKKEWESFYKAGGVIVADRYTTANMVHQAAKIADFAARHKYIQWLLDFEFSLFHLPEPDGVIFLDMPPEYSAGLLQARAPKPEAGQVDIHERDVRYLEQSYRNACQIARRYNWHRVSCVEAGRLKSIAEIHEEIYKLVRELILV